MRIKTLASLLLFFAQVLAATANEDTELRIVSLLPNMTEFVFALGAGNALVAVDNFSDTPDAAKKLPKVGDFQSVSLESIVKFRPNLLLMMEDYYPEETLIKLSRLGIRAVTCTNKTIAQVEDCADRLGFVLRNPTGGRKIATDIEDARLGLTTRSKGKQKKVLLLLQAEPYYGVGANNFIDEIVTAAGGINVLKNAKQPYPLIGRESILTTNPDVIIVFSDHDRRAVASLLNQSKQGANIQIEVVDENLISRPGPRVGEAMTTLNATLFPASTPHSNR
jgi:ABC-type hemin transport system substrate-binding protein